MVLATLLALALGPAPQITIQEVSREAPPGFVTEWHEVQQGETLEGLSERLSGSATLWQQNWRLNPDVSNPHVLLP